MTPGPGIEPGPHWWEASALTTAPSLLPHTTKTIAHSHDNPKFLFKVFFHCLIMCI